MDIFDKFDFLFGVAVRPGLHIAVLGQGYEGITSKPFLGHDPGKDLTWVVS